MEKNYMARRKTTREKLYRDGQPKITTDRRTGQSMVVPTGTMVEETVRRIPAGRVVRIRDLRAAMAAQAGTQTACPLVTGIMLRLLAELMEEEQPENPAPWWRVVRDDGTLNHKLPGYPYRQTELLLNEGIEVQMGRKPKVVSGLADETEFPG